MRLLFIENRYRTAHWEVIANALRADGMLSAIRIICHTTLPAR